GPVSPPSWRGRTQMRDTSLETPSASPLHSLWEGLTNGPVQHMMPSLHGDPTMHSRMQPLSAVELDDAYAKALPDSQQLFARRQQIFPDGVTHDNRRMQPFPIYIERAKGAYKWDVDGHRYIDYWMGHGALLLGHSPPQICRAVIDQMQRGTHYGASHAQEVEGGEWVWGLGPCAEMVA